MNLKLLVMGISVIMIVIVGGYLFPTLTQNTNKSKSTTSTKMIDVTRQDSMELSPQSPGTSVLVDRVTLNKDGFLVVREMEDDKLSQVVEMSRPLQIGTHKNITISLGGAEIKNKELIVMIYEDYGNDGVFNDLDMPAINAEGFMTARYVKTGKQLSTSITEGEGSGMSHAMPGMQGMVKVRYTDEGFIPEKVEVEAGKMVEFINESSTVMWVASADHPGHTKLPTFDQFRPYKKGSLYRYQFDKKGTWEFHDHINPSRGGVIVVK